MGVEVDEMGERDEMESDKRAAAAAACQRARRAPSARALGIWRPFHIRDSPTARPTSACFVRSRYLVNLRYNFIGVF